MSLDQDMRKGARAPKPTVDPIFRGATSTPIQIKESFSWMTPEWKSVKKSRKQVQIKGVALTSNIISKNKRQYLDEELKMAARTLSGKPININHSDRQIVGNVTWAEYENGALEYLGVVKKEPYVTMLKEKDPRIAGVSVQAAYLHNRCSVCGERFFSEKAFKGHMEDEHGIKNGVQEVHGIIFDGLSLVLSPEIPGVPTTSIQLMETDSNKTVMRLFETYLREKGYAVTQEKTVSISKIGVGKPKMKLGEPKDEHGCEPDEVWDPATQTCVKKAAEQAEDGVTKPTQADIPSEKIPECAEDELYNPIINMCVPQTQVNEIYDNIDYIFRSATRPQLKHFFETWQKTLDHFFVEYKEKINTDLSAKLETTIAMLKNFQTVFFNNKTKKIEETAQFDNRLERAEIRIDNLEAKLRGQFKGQQKPLKTSAEPTGNIDKDMRKSARKRG